MKRTSLTAACVALGVVLPFCGGCRKRQEPAPAQPAASFSGSSGPLTLTVSLDRTSVSTIEDITMTVESLLEPGFALAEPEVGGVGDEFGPLTILGVTRTEPVLTEAGQLRIVRTFQLEPFLPGDYQTPSLEFTYTPLDGARGGSLKTSPLSVKVTSVLDEGVTDIAEARGTIDPLEPERFPWGVAILAAAAVAGTALLVGGVWWAHKRRRNRSAFDDALKRLDALRGELPERSGDLRSVWHDAGAILASGIAQRLDARAPHLDGSGLAAVSREWFGLMETDRHLLTDLLERLDEVRFAGKEPSEAQTAAMLADSGKVMAALRGASDLIVDARKGGPA